jgi:hypothetical protein
MRCAGKRHVTRSPAQQVTLIYGKATAGRRQPIKNASRPGSACEPGAYGIERGFGKAGTPLRAARPVPAGQAWCSEPCRRCRCEQRRGNHIRCEPRKSVAPSNSDAPSCRNFLRFARLEIGTGRARYGYQIKHNLMRIAVNRFCLQRENFLTICAAPRFALHRGRAASKPSASAQRRGRLCPVRTTAQSARVHLSYGAAQDQQTPDR